MSNVTEQIEDVYIDALINGALTTTKSITKTSDGKTIESVVSKRTIVPKDCLEYLRTRSPDKWSPPPPVPQVLIKQETIAIAQEELRKLLIPIMPGE
jgi:hypothetical protein